MKIMIVYRKIKDRLEQSLTETPSKSLLDYITHCNQEQIEYRYISDKRSKGDMKLILISLLISIVFAGSWEKGFYTDEFGDITDNPYITTEIIGTFSNSATTNSILKVIFIIARDRHVERDNVYIRMLEYGSHRADYGDWEIPLVKIKHDGKELKSLNKSLVAYYNTIEFKTWIKELPKPEPRFLHVILKELFFGKKEEPKIKQKELAPSQEMIELLSKGGKFQFYIYVNRSTYLFNIEDVSGFKELYNTTFPTLED
jgi:hypothetical protein